MNINIVTKNQTFPVIQKLTSKPTAFKGGLTQDCIELNNIPPEYEEQYLEQQRFVEEAIIICQNEISDNKSLKNIDEIKRAFYEALLEPKNGYYSQIIELMRSINALRREEQAYKTKRQEVENAKKQAIFDTPNWKQNLINVIRKNRPYYDSSRDSKDQSKGFLKMLADEIISDLDQDFRKKETAVKLNFTQEMERILKPYFSEQQDKETASQIISEVISVLIETNRINSLSGEIEKLKSEIKQYETQIQAAQEKINKYREKLALYKQFLIKNPNLAPFYKPHIDSQTIKKLLERHFCIELSELQDKTITTSDLYDLSEMGYLKILSGGFYYNSLIDVTDETSRQTADLLRAKKGKLRTIQQIKNEYKIPESYILQAGLDTLEFKSKNKDYDYTLTYIELTENTLKKIHEQQIRYERTKNIPSEKYFCGEDNRSPRQYVPASYLKKLGFWTRTGLLKLVQEGKLKGKIKDITTSEGTVIQQAYIDLHDNENIKILQSLRDRNPNTLSYTQFAKAAGLTNREVMEAIKNGDIEIIREIIFHMDSDYKYIDLNIEKNRRFLEQKKFEKELCEQLRKAELERESKEKELERIRNKDIREQFASLRMKLVWHFCPETKRIASNLASGDGYLCKLLVKDSKDEELTKREQAKVNSYRKTLWLSAGTDELKEGFKKADEVLNQFKSFGINSIEDEEIKNIFKMYFD